jgi:Lipocalin-like domain
MSKATSRISLLDTRARLIGAWRLLSWYEKGADGKVHYPLGENAAGQLIYSAEGQVSDQPMRVNVPRFENDDWREATPEGRARAWLDYFGYFGTFSIDEEQDAVIHHVEGGWFPNLNGANESDFSVSKGNGSYSTPTLHCVGQVRILWEKISSSNSS